MTVHERPNRASPSEAASFVEEIDRLEQDREEKLRVLDAEFKIKKRVIQKVIDADQKTILSDAKKQGVDKGGIRFLIGVQKARRKADAIVEKAESRFETLEDDVHEYFVDIRTALGSDFAGLPLGAAAVVRENGQDETTAAVIAAVKDSATSDEWDASAPKKKGKTAPEATAAH